MNEKHINDNKGRFLRWKDVQPRVGICRTHAENLAKEGKFPAPIKLLGRKVIVWVESEIDAWINEQIDNRPKKSDYIQ